ncbi:MAG: aminotransferase class V-fold PLP-dependent enzyme [Clostridia bacterium]|nr:aminotransferase class V-fold PLP-dependent enzyme [Clostridia bacterium]
MLNFDNASTTKISKSSLDAYVKASEDFFNPSSLYAQAAKVKQDIEQTRDFFKKQFKAKQGSTFIFTGSASESNNAVLNSCITRKDKKYIIGAGEHSSIHNTAIKYKEQGYNIVFLPLKANGGADINALSGLLDQSVAFVSIIHVSNETGAINDIKQIANIVKEYNPNIIVHSDGVQAVGKIDINLKEIGVDYYTVSAHKINGPKGIGALYIANPNKFKPFIIGGGQEMNLRAGTENTPAINAFKVALQEIKPYDYSKHKQVLLQNIDVDYYLVSDNECVDNIISVCFKGVRGETIEHILEQKGYIIGTGSACNSKAGKNRVLSQIVKNEYIDGAIRISFDKDIKIEDCVNLGKEITNAVKLYKERTKR